MAFSINSFLAAVDGLLGEVANSELPELRRLRQIKAAIARYNVDRPDIATGDITGDGGRYYPIEANLSAWSDQLSRVIRVEYPAYAVTADQEPQYLDPGDYDDQYYIADGTRYLFFYRHSPSSSDTIRVTYTAPYAWTASSTDTTAVSQAGHGFSEDDYIYKDAAGTWYEADSPELATHQVAASPATDTFTAEALEVATPAAHFDALAALAAALCCDAIATKYARSSDPTLNADSVDHAGQATRFETRAREYRSRYTEAVTAGDDRPENMTPKPKPAGGFVDWHRERDARSLTHKRGRRW